jgi:hypothetical protein
MSGGKGGGSDKAYKLAKQQAEEAARKEAERQMRLTTGTKQINDIFGGIGDGFYKKYQDAYLGYYQPQVNKQYNDARQKLTYDLARAGTLRSSVAGEKQGDLYEKKLDNDAMIRSQADAATGQLRNNVSDAKNTAITQLYATEDPTLASNIAVNSVRGLQGQTPKYDPLGELFNIAAIGAAGYLNANSQRASASTTGSVGSGSASRTYNVG